MNVLPSNGDTNGFERSSPPSFLPERNGSVSSDNGNGTSDTPPSSSRKRTGSSCNSGTAEKRVATKVCRICGDKAFSYNFNVITCESCKAFFRRNALKEKEIRCPFNQNCDINVVSRRFCQYCRLTKCFNEGMKKEWIMSDEARLEKKKRVQDNRDRRMAEAKVREGSRRQQANGEVECNGENSNTASENVPPQQIPLHEEAPVPMDTSPSMVPSHSFYPSVAVTAPSIPQVSSPQHSIHINPTIGTASPLLPSSIIPTVPVVPQAIPFSTSIQVPPQIINETLASVNVPDMNINGALSNSMSASIGMTPLNTESHVQTLLAQSVQAAVTPPIAQALVNPELAVVQQAQVQLSELAQVAIAQQQQLAAVAVQQQLAAVAGPTVPTVAAPAPSVMQQAQAQLNELAQVAIAHQHQQQAIEAAQIVAHAQQQQLVAAVAAATATAAGMVSTPAQTLFPSNPAVMMPAQSVVVTPSQLISVPLSQPVSSVSQTTAPVSSNVSRKDMIAVPRDLLQKLCQNYTNVQSKPAEKKDSSPPPPSEAPVKCECKCRCGRYPGETLIVDQVMMDMLENSTATKPCDEGATWIDRTDDEMTSFEKEMMSCISDDARNAAESGGIIDEEEDLEMSEYDQDLLEEIDEAIKKTHKISAPDWVFTMGRNASDAEIIQEAIKATTIFCQKIDVFCKLSREDQMIIVKVGCLGFMILNAARSFNFLTIGAAATNDIHDISIRLFKMFHSEWKSSDAIINVMCMLLLFDPDVSGIENVEGLDDEYDQYSLLMEKVMYLQSGSDKAKAHAEFNEVQALLRSVAASLSSLNELLDKCGTDSAILAILDNR